MQVRLILIGVAFALCLLGCRGGSGVPNGPLEQRGYLWQRAWNPAVREAALEADQRLEGMIVLGAEISLKSSAPEVVWTTLDWDTLGRLKHSVALGLRVAPFAGPFRADDLAAKTIHQTAAHLVAEAKAHGVPIRELQLDFDCAQSKLAGYGIWVRSLRASLGEVRLVMTALPAWLEEREFSKLIAEVDGYVLQVHSVPVTREGSLLCDVEAVRQWVRKAGALKRPFSVALPTYRCVAGYDPDGKLLGVMMDSVQPAWPAGTRVLEFKTDPAALAKLIGEWKTARPAQLQEIIWYRVPVGSDLHNWRWPTLQAVMEGRPPEATLVVEHSGENPVDLVLANHGEADGMAERAIKVTWSNAKLVAWDALSGWRLEIEPEQVTFRPEEDLPIATGSQRSIGWLRFDQSAQIRTRIEP